MLCARRGWLSRQYALAGVFRGVVSVVAPTSATTAAADGAMTVTLEDRVKQHRWRVIAVYRLPASGAGRSSTSVLVTVAGGPDHRLSELRRPGGDQLWA